MLKGLLAVLLYISSLVCVYCDCPTVSGDSGYSLDVLKGLTFLTVSGNATYYINLCGPAPDCTGLSPKVVSCKHSSQGSVTLGTADNITAAAQGDYVSVVFSGDVTTHLTLTCGPSLGRPELQLYTTSHVFFVWRTLAGCRDHKVTGQVPCYTYNTRKELYDLGGLVGTNYNIVPTDQNSKSIYFSVCGPVTGTNSCNGGAACHIDPSIGAVWNIGNAVTGPHASSEGVVISYKKKVSTPSCTEVTTVISFICSPQSQTQPQLIYTNVSCTYNIIWRTDHACPIQQVHDIGCKLQARGVSYDLTPLMDKDYTAEDTDHTYSLAVCRAMQGPCKGKISSGCQSSKNDPTRAWPMGSYTSGSLVWNDEGITASYTGGQSCSNGQVRATKILFVCDKSKDFGSPVLSEEVYCFYSFIWRTKYACPVTQSQVCSKYGSDGELYDLSSMYNMSWTPLSSQPLLLSVCGELKECPGASLCRRNGSEGYLPLASVSEHFNLMDDKSIVLTYEGAGECKHSKNAVMQIDMICKQGDFSSPPLLLSSSACLYIFSWSTAAACPSHNVIGTGCGINDAVTGLSYDLTGLAATPRILMVGSTSITLRLCEPLVNSECGDDVSVCRAQDKVNVGTTNNNLVYMDRSLLAVYQGVICEAGQSYRTFVEFQCDTQNETLTLQQANKCTYYVTWGTPQACPQYPVECAVSNATNRYDLSSLYSKGNLEWAGLLNNTQTALYVRACGQLVGGTGCDHSAGICAVTAVGKYNLGRATSGLELSDSILSLTYTHGDHVCTDRTLKAKTVLDFRCDRVSKEDKIEAAEFNDRLCLYVIVVSSPLGCTEIETIGHNCSVIEPLSGSVYDFSYLTSDVSFKNGLSNFRLHLCGPLTKGCGGDSRAGACEIVNGNEISLGASSTSLSLEDGLFTVTYKGGGKCGKDNTKTSVVTIRCNKEGDKAPIYLNHDAESCTYHFVWELAAACPTEELSCKAVDTKLQEYDLTALRRDTSWSISTGGTRYMFNVCSGADMCGDGSSVCMTSGGGQITSLGRMSGEPVVRADGVVELMYHHGALCKGVGGQMERRWTTSVLFMCSVGSESAPIVKTDYDACQVVIEWHSLHACPATFVTGQNCTVTDNVTGNVYDLWSLSHKDLFVQVKEHHYSFSFCKPLSKPCNGKLNAGSCQYSSSTKEERSNGVFNKTLTFSNGVLILKYIGGDVCSKGDIRETTIKLACDYGMKPGMVDLQDVKESSHCVYEVLGFSSIPCDKEVLSRCDIDGFDLSPLALTRGNWFEHKNNHTFTINVCRAVNKPSPCSTTTAVCMWGSQTDGISLGEISTAHLAYTDSTLKLTYTGSDLCPSTKTNYKTVIQFICNDGDEEGTPILLSNHSCTYIFLWSSKYACSNRIVADGCKLTDTLSGKSLSLSSLCTQAWTAHSVTASYDIAICNPLSKVKGTQCAADTAVCYREANEESSSRGKYTTQTKLESSEGLESISLTYSGGGLCTASDGSVLQYTSLINFDCVKDKKEEKPTFISEVDCMSLFTFSTPLVCPEQHTSCEVMLGQDVIDLSVISQPFSIVKDLTNMLDGTLYIAVCRSLGPMESIACPPGSAGCEVLNNGQIKSLGKPKSPLTVNSDGALQLVYTDGASCELSPGVPSKIQTTIIFRCVQGRGVGIPQLFDIKPCNYGIIWETSAACKNSDYKPQHSCKVHDTALGFSYDLTEMALTANYYEVDVAGTSYTINICGVVSECGAFSAACARANNKSVSLGSVETVETRLVSGGIGEVEVVYTAGDKCPGDGAFLREVKIILMCCNEDDINLKLIDNHGDCQYVFALCSPKMCKYNPKECLFKVGGDLYDFSALSRQTDNWITTNGDRTFYLNVCRGVNTKAVPVKGCSDNSIACMTQQGAGTSTTLGNIATRTQVHKSGSSNITLTYDGGQSVICTDRSVRTKIVFICGAGLGSPEYVGDKNCEFTFRWKTYVACIESNKPVISEKCTFNNPLSQKYTDLRQGKTSHVVETGRGKVYIAPCGSKLTFPKPCKGGTVCIVDIFHGVTTNIIESRIQVLAEENTADMIIYSSTRCSDSASGTWKAILMYTCNLTAPDEGLWSYEGISQCHVLIGVQSPVVCPTTAKANTHHTLFLVIMVGIAFCFTVVIVYVLSQRDKRTKIMRKIRALIPVRKTPGPPMMYQRVRQLRGEELMSDSDEEIVGL